MKKLFSFILYAVIPLAFASAIGPIEPHFNRLSAFAGTPVVNAPKTSDITVIAIAALAACIAVLIVMRILKRR